NRGSGGGSLSVPLPKANSFAANLVLDYLKEGFLDERTDFKRGHAALRSEAKAGSGTFRINLDGTILDQNPASPQFFDGPEPSPLVPPDSNQNPAGAFLNDRRYVASLGYDRPAGRAAWSSLFSYSYATEDVFRGFLVDATTSFPNAHGFR